MCVKIQIPPLLVTTYFGNHRLYTYLRHSTTIACSRWLSLNCVLFFEQVHIMIIRIAEKRHIIIGSAIEIYCRDCFLSPPSDDATVLFGSSCGLFRKRMRSVNDPNTSPTPHSTLPVPPPQSQLVVNVTLLLMDEVVYEKLEEEVEE